MCKITHWVTLFCADNIVLYSFGLVFLCYFCFQLEYKYSMYQMNNVLLLNCLCVFRWFNV